MSITHKPQGLIKVHKCDYENSAVVGISTWVEAVIWNKNVNSELNNTNSARNFLRSNLLS